MVYFEADKNREVEVKNLLVRLTKKQLGFCNKLCHLNLPYFLNSLLHF